MLVFQEKENVKEFLNSLSIRDSQWAKNWTEDTLWEALYKKIHQELIDKHKEEFEKQRRNYKHVDVYIEFAWVSIFLPYWRATRKKHQIKNLTIIEALKKYPVTISIETEEPNMLWRRTILQHSIHRNVYKKNIVCQCMPVKMQGWDNSTNKFRCERIRVLWGE